MLNSCFTITAWSAPRHESRRSRAEQTGEGVGAGHDGDYPAHVRCRNSRLPHLHALQGMLIGQQHPVV